jgi:hypothetical protein
VYNSFSQKVQTTIAQMTIANEKKSTGALLFFIVVPQLKQTLSLLDISAPQLLHVTLFCCSFELRFISL